MGSRGFPAFSDKPIVTKQSCFATKSIQKLFQDVLLLKQHIQSNCMGYSVANYPYIFHPPKMCLDKHELWPTFHGLPSDNCTVGVPWKTLTWCGESSNRSLKTMGMNSSWKPSWRRCIGKSIRQLEFAKISTAMELVSGKVSNAVPGDVHVSHGWTHEMCLV